MARSASTMNSTTARVVSIVEDAKNKLALPPSIEDYVVGALQGRWTVDAAAPPKPRDLSDTPAGVPNGLGDSKAPLGTIEEAKRVWDQRGFMPAVKGPWEDERQRVLKRYNFTSTHQIRSIDRIVDTAAHIFNAPIVLVTLVLEDRQVLVSTKGWADNERVDGRDEFAVPLETSFCPHAMARSPDDSVWVCDPANDWRFRMNPYVKDGGPIQFFASANVHLPASTLSSDPKGLRLQSSPKVLPVGSLCIIDHAARDPSDMTPEKKRLLTNLAEMIAREFELGYEKRRMDIVATQTKFIGDLFRSQMVFAARSDPSRTGSAADKLVDSTANQLHTLIGADAAVILDLRSFCAPLPPSSVNPLAETSTSLYPLRRPSLGRRQSSKTSLTSDISSSSLTNGWGSITPPHFGAAGAIKVLQSSGAEWRADGLLQSATSAIADALVAFYATGACEWDETTTPSPLSNILPRETKASLAVPIFDHEGESALMVIVCSYQRYYRFEAGDISLLEHTGNIIIGSLLRQRIVEADRAKLAFVSQISHELRTPLHAAASQIELIRSVCPASALSTISPLLDIAEVCNTSLQEILDDTLEFSKMSHSVTDVTSRPPRLSEIDIETLIVQVVQGCWSKRRQSALVPLAADEAKPRGEVSIRLDCRLKGLKAMVDVGGLKRVLFNLIGNSLKFTESGTISIVVTESAAAVASTLDSDAATRAMLIEVIDTGRGMSPEFLLQLGTPFTQADSFSTGAGLGVSISDQIVKRMRGHLHYSSTIDVGTTASILLPLQLVVGDESRLSDHSNTSIRDLTDELAKLFQAREATSLTAEKTMSFPPSASIVSDDVARIHGAPHTNGIMRSKSTSRVRCLCVDDNPVSLRVLEMLLKVKGIDHLSATSGEEAVQLFRSANPPINLVWCDVQMPRMNGLEATKLMREWEDEQGLDRSRIIAVSGLSADLGHHSLVLESGQVDEWLVKGGPTLKTLASDLIKYEAVLAELGRLVQEE